jgi:polar amino acid transport system substrate-binding protein
VVSSGVSRRGLLRGAAGGTAAAALAVGAGCTPVDLTAEAGGGRLLQRLRDSGRVRMGFANERPFGYLDAEGRLTGQSPEVGRAVFQRMGIDQVEPTLVDFSALIPGLNAGLFDVISAGLFITSKRCPSIEFTNPSFNAPEALLLPKGNPHGLRDIASFARVDARMGMLTGSVEDGYAAAAGVPKERIVTFPDQASGIDGLLAGRADALVLTRVSLRSSLAQRPGVPLEIGPPFVPVVDGKRQWGAGAFGFRKGETAVVQAFNAGLAELQARDGVLPLVEQFGFGREEMTDLRAADICAGTAG